MDSMIEISHIICLFVGFKFHYQNQRSSNETHTLTIFVAPLDANLSLLFRMRLRCRISLLIPSEVEISTVSDIPRLSIPSKVEISAALFSGSLRSSILRRVCLCTSDMTPALWRSMRAWGYLWQDNNIWGISAFKKIWSIKSSRGISERYTSNTSSGTQRKMVPTKIFPILLRWPLLRIILIPSISPFASRQKFLACCRFWIENFSGRVGRIENNFRSRIRNCYWQNKISSEQKIIMSHPQKQNCVGKKAFSPCKLTVTSEKKISSNVSSKTKTFLKKFDIILIIVLRKNMEL